MPKKKYNDEDEGATKTKNFDLLEEVFDEDEDIDPSILEDTFSDDFSEYNDVDDF